MSFHVMNETMKWAQNSGVAASSVNEIDSTNLLAKEEAFDLEEPLQLYLANHQTSGRGRFDRNWEDVGDGTALLSSWSFVSPRPPRPILSPLIGLALFRAAHATWPGQNFSLKAPNDLFLGKQKVAGLLLESVTQGTEHRLIIGLGMNVFASPDLPEAGDLKSLLPPAFLLVEYWRGFCDRFLMELTTALMLDLNELGELERTALAYALNYGRRDSDAVTFVSAQGDLEFRSGKKVQWSDL